MPEEPFLYARIAEDLRRDIMRGKLRAGARLPAIRSLELRWQTTAGTVQRAYQELARQGLIESRPGRGTFVSKELVITDIDSPLTLRKAGIIHRAEGWLLEMLSLGYSPGDIEDSFHEAIERWRSLKRKEGGE